MRRGKQKRVLGDGGRPGQTRESWIGARIMPFCRLRQTLVEGSAFLAGYLAGPPRCQDAQGQLTHPESKAYRSHGFGGYTYIVLLTVGIRRSIRV